MSNRRLGAHHEAFSTPAKPNPRKLHRRFSVPANISKTQADFPNGCPPACGISCNNSGGDEKNAGATGAGISANLKHAQEKTNPILDQGRSIVNTAPSVFSNGPGATKLEANADGIVKKAEVPKRVKDQRADTFELPAAKFNAATGGAVGSSDSKGEMLASGKTEAAQAAKKDDASQTLRSAGALAGANYKAGGATPQQNSEESYTPSSSAPTQPSTSETDFGSTGGPADQETLGTPDPDDYFARTRLDENLFKKVESVYKEKQKALE